MWLLLPRSPRKGPVRRTSQGAPSSGGVVVSRVEARVGLGVAGWMLGGRRGGSGSGSGGGASSASGEVRVALGSRQLMKAEGVALTQEVESYMVVSGGGELALYWGGRDAL